MTKKEYHFEFYKSSQFDNLLLISNEFANHINKKAIAKKGFDKIQFDKDESKFLKQNSKNKNYRYFICRLDSEFIGFTFFGLQDNNKTEGFIGELFVKPKHRKNGIATRLLEEATKWITENECTFIEIDVNTKDISALKLYKKLGFKEQKHHFITLKKNCNNK